MKTRFEMYSDNGPRKPDWWIITIAVLVLAVVAWMTFKLIDSLP